MTTLSDAALDHSALPVARKGGRVGSIGARAAYAYVSPFFLIFGAFRLYPLLYPACVSLHNVTLGALHNSPTVCLQKSGDLGHNRV